MGANRNKLIIEWDGMLFSRIEFAKHTHHGKSYVTSLLKSEADCVNGKHINFLKATDENISPSIFEKWDCIVDGKRMDRNKAAKLLGVNAKKLCEIRDDVCCSMINGYKVLFADVED